MCRCRGSRACWSPSQPHPRHRYCQELLLGTGARLDLSEVKKTNRIFWYPKALVYFFVQTVFSDQIHGTSDRTEHGRVQPCSAVKTDNQKVHLF